MAQTISKKDLQAVVDRLNRELGTPMAPYTRTAKGVTANIGNYHLDYAYSGVQLVRMSNQGGGVSQPLGSGFWSKREFYNMLQAFIKGVETVKYK